MGALVEIWPLFGLRVVSGDLELRLPDDSDLVALGDLAAAGLHDPDVMPFFEPWTDLPVEARRRSVLQWNWRARGEWTPENWRLDLVAVVDGEVVGSQGLHAEKFAALGEVETGSWLARHLQGRGIGTRMRTAVLHLAFAGLGARAARSGAFTDNPASLRVSEKLGYRPDGTESHAPRGEAATMVRLLLTRQDWEAGPRPEVTIENLEPCLALFGAGGPRLTRKGPPEG
jgi:RimJ/RimL family protein N-acetyltransferase